MSRMTRLLVLVIPCWLAACSDSKSKSDMGANDDMSAVHAGDGGVIFDPCATPQQPGFDPTTSGLPTCCTTGPAHCVPSSEVSTGFATIFNTCDATSLCMPDDVISAGGAYDPPACTSSLGSAPGVCLSTCIALVANNPQSALLVQDSCIKGDVCVPCINPLTNEPTGACTFNQMLCGGTDGGTGDGGTEAMCPYTGPQLVDPSTFGDCAPACGGSHCVDSALVPDAQKPLLSSCTAKSGGAGYCTPDVEIAAGGNYVPPTCKSIAGAEGRCLTTCLPSVAAQADQLPQDTCDAGLKCVPCYNPVAQDPTAPTGACTIACDAPKDPPTVLMCPYTGPAVVDPTSFPDCSPMCGGAHCLPAAYVPMAEQSLLTACTGGFCTPDTLIAGAGYSVPASCKAFATDTTTPVGEGRCLSACIPSVASQASQLHDPAPCASDELCAPCYDPFTGKDTGACHLDCDKPADATPYKFPTCCTYQGVDQGTCVPKQNISSTQQSELEQNTCASSDFLCVPNENLPGGVGQACTPTLGGKGTCISDCANLGLGALLGQADCSANHTCVPCSQAPAGSTGC